MMIKKKQTKFVSIKKLAQKYGLLINDKTAARWGRIGTRGVKLRSIRIGNKRLTTVQWFEEFLEKLTK